MRSRALLIIVVTLVGAALAGCGSTATADGRRSTSTRPAPAGLDPARIDFADLTGEARPQVDAVDNNFQLRYVTVKAQTTVTFRNDGQNPHNVIPVDGLAFTGIEVENFGPGAEKTVTFTDPGDYPYYCTLHGTRTKGMTGFIRVVE